MTSQDDPPPPRPVRKPRIADLGYGTLTVAVAMALVIGCVVASVPLTCRLYWGYWFSRPDSSETIRDVVRIDRYTEFHTHDSTSQSGTEAFLESAQWARPGVGESPTGQLCAALLRAGLRPTSEAQVPSDVRADVQRVVDARDPPRSPRVTIITCTASDGSERVLVSVQGDELSNDHYGYWELATAGPAPLRVLSETYFEYDVAGLEEIAHILGVFPGALTGLLAAGIWIVVRWYRGRTRARTDLRRHAG